MALTSTLGSPGIEIREIDNSVRIDASTSTTVFVPGFAAQGPVEEVISIGSLEDFQLIYGKPTNGAERYFYYTVKALLDKGGSGLRVLTSRLPYGAGAGDSVSDAYTLLAYPAVPVIKKNHGTPENPVYYDMDSIVLKDALTASDFKLTKSGKEASLNVNESTYQFHIEEDYLNSIGFKFTDTEKFSIAFGTATLPATTATTATAPTLSLTTTISGKNTTKTFKGIGHIATEFYKGKAFVHLAYSIFPDSDVITEDGVLKPSDKAKSVGCAALTLVYDQTTENAIEASNISDYTITSKTFTDAKFCPAFEFAASYDGQSKAQLGQWIDLTTKPTTTTVINSIVEDTTKFTKDVTYLIGAPATFQISLKDYYNIITGDFINWSRRPYDFTGSSKKVYDSHKDDESSESQFGLIEALGHSAFIAINTSRTAINENFEGYYLGLNDNMFVAPSDDYIYNAITGVKVTTESYITKNQNNAQGASSIGLIDSVDPTNSDFDVIGNQRLTFKLDSNNQGSLSRVMSRNITSKDISSTEFDDTVSLGLFKLTKTTDTNDILKLSYSIREKYNWSYAKNRVKSAADSTKPVSYYVNNIMESSNNVTIMVNPFISDKDFLTHDGVFHGKMRMFSDKLCNNLDYFESKYLCRNYTPVSNTSNNKGLIAPIKLANSNLLSYQEMIKQAGVSPYILRTALRSNITETEQSNYKNFAPINSIYPFGVYTTATTTQKIIGQVPTKLQRALQLVENDEEYPDIDLVLESGLGTIFMNSNGNDFSGEYASRTLIVSEDTNQETTDNQSTKEYIFDESVILTGVEDMRTSRSSLSDEAQDVLEDYLAVTNVFLQFANAMQNGGRGDCFFISDIPRGILIKGKDTKVTNLYGIEIENNAYDFGESVVHSFPTSIYSPIKHQFDSIVSTYMSTYAQWVKIYDDFSGDKVWIPVSGHIAANIASTDAVYGPWYASAGLRRGVISGVLDYALSPSISQRTDLYKICINSVPKIPNYGVTIWGIRTMSKKDSAFDQNTCRRTFLYMEKKIKQLLRYYIFEPNTSYTRLQIFNDIDPFLEGIKNKGGIYSYTLVTDTTVNTPEIINNGDLVVAIAAAPTRTAENIIVEFTANKYSEEVSASESIQ